MPARSDMRHAPPRQVRVQPVEEGARQAAADPHEREDGQLPDLVGPLDFPAAELHRHLGAERPPLRLVVHGPREEADRQRGDRGADEHADEDRGVHVRGALLDGEQHAADGRPKGRSDAGRCTSRREVPGLVGDPVGRHVWSGVHAGDLRCDDGAAVDHRPLLTARQARRDAADDAHCLSAEGAQDEDVRDVDPVQHTLDLRDATAGGQGLDVAHQRPGD
mmetsp:Transcript_128061/g.370630  ORF Transcript_128061/g.370630 Transcript_128061/m.370630 type:complete len:220 (-) Transcript_128061:443-1102(-)